MPEGLLDEAVDDEVDGGVEDDEEVGDVVDDEDLWRDVVAPALVALCVVRRLHRQRVQHDEYLKSGWRQMKRNPLANVTYLTCF